MRLSLALGLLVAAPALAAPTVESVSPGAGQRGTEFTCALFGSRLADPQEVLFYTPGVTCTKVVGKAEGEVVLTLKAAADCRLGLHPFRLRCKGGASEVRFVRVTSFPVVTETDAEHGTPAKAQPVTLNTTVAGSLDSGDTDYYSVTLKKGQRLSAEVEAVRLGVSLTDTTVTVSGPDGKQLAAVDDTPLFRQDPFVSVVAPADGTYTVLVQESNAGGGDNSRYLLHAGTFPRPAAVFPAGGQAGTETEVTLIGDGDKTVKLKLPDAGKPFELYPSDAGGIAPTPNPFRVSPFPNVLETEPNDDLKQAGKATDWPVAFNGVIGKPGDVDHYRFRAKKGQEIDVQAFAFRVGSPADTVVAVLDSAGELLAGNDDDETHDSRLQFTVPADGEYLVRVTDKRKQGGPNFIYRVELTAPTVGLTVFLPEKARKSQDRQVIAVPRGNRVTAFLAVRRDGVAGPVRVTAPDLPSGVKADLGTLAEGEYLLPVVFEATADAPLGGRLVTLTGTVGEGKSAVSGGFAQTVVTVRGPGDSALHSLDLDKLAVVVVDEAPLTVTVTPPAAPLAADGTLDVTVKIVRGKDFAEAVEVFFPCLPPGVEVPTSVVIPADKSEVTVTLVASKDAELGEWKLIAEAATARPGRAGRDPLAVGNNGLGTPVPGMGRRPRRAAQSFSPVASDARAITLAAPPVKGTFPDATTEQGKTLKVICKLDADKPLPAAFTAKLDGLPPRATAEPVAVKADAKSVEFMVTVDPTTPPGENRSLVCELAGTVNGQKVVYRVGRGGLLKVEVPGAVVTGPGGKPLSPLDALRLKEKK